MKNLKPSRIRFTKEAARIITERGGERAGSYRYDPNKSDLYDCEWYLIKTSSNALKLTVYGELNHKLMYSVFAMLKLSDSRVGNPHSGKVNFHMQGEVGSVLEELIAGWRIY